MTKAKISIASGYKPLEVDLWGSPFHTLQPIRSVSIKQADIRRRIAEEDDDDKLMALLAELLDTRLAPAEGKRTKASTLIVRKWEADELTLAQLDQFVTDVEEADRDG